MVATPHAVAALLSGLSVAALLTACGEPHQSTPSDGGAAAIGVEATDSACHLARTTAPAGTITFDITNNGTNVTEFYLYAAGDQIMGEVENIAPGLHRRLIVEVPHGGHYDAACKPGMLGPGIRQPLLLTGGAPEDNNRDSAKIAAARSYAAYVSDNCVALREQTSRFVEAITARRLDEAKTEYARTRVFYERIEPVAEKFGDLDPSIDAREADLEAGQIFTGFHKLEKELWISGPQPDMTELADRLRTDVESLTARAQALNLTALDLANGAKSLLEEVATRKVTGEEEAFSHTDLWDFQSNLDGSKAAVLALRPILADRDATLVNSLDTRFAQVQALLDQTRVGDGFTQYTELSPNMIKKLAAAVDALSEPLSKVAQTVAT